jgi:hypothetical protein
MAYLYRHVRLDKNEPFYIGIGSDNNYKRAYSFNNRNKHWKNITNKSNYNVEILLDDLTWEQACEKEREFIKLYGRNDQCKGFLCNYTDGGEGVLGLIVSSESRKKMSVAQTGKKQSAQQIAKRVLKLTGNGNYWFGKQFSDEYKQKLSLAKKGKKRNPIIMKKLHEATQKKVIDLFTNTTYNSIKDLAAAFNVHNSTASRWLKSKSSQFKLII